jgi:hypothetical protein
VTFFFLTLLAGPTKCGSAGSAGQPVVESAGAKGARCMHLEPQPAPGLCVVRDLSPLLGLLLAAARALVRIRMPATRKSLGMENRNGDSDDDFKAPGKKARGKREARKGQQRGTSSFLSKGVATPNAVQSVSENVNEVDKRGKKRGRPAKVCAPTTAQSDEDADDVSTRASPNKERCVEKSAGELSRQSTKEMAELVVDDASVSAAEPGAAPSPDAAGALSRQVPQEMVADAMAGDAKRGVGEHGPVIVSSWRDPSVANDFCSRLLAACKTPSAGASASIGEVACGMDCEWCPVWWQTDGGGGDVIQLLQLYSPCVGTLVYSTGGGASTCRKPLPDGIVALLADPRVVKCGVNIEGDARRIAVYT